MYVVYYRMEANVVDMRVFRDANEFVDWLKFSSKMEPIAIIGIYDKDTEYSEGYKDYAKFVKKFRTGQIVNGQV